MMTNGNEDPSKSHVLGLKRFSLAFFSNDYLLALNMEMIFRSDLISREGGGLPQSRWEKMLGTIQLPEMVFGDNSLDLVRFTKPLA